MSYCSSNILWNTYTTVEYWWAGLSCHLILEFAIEQSWIRRFSKVNLEWKLSVFHLTGAYVMIKAVKHDVLSWKEEQKTLCKTWNYVKSWALKYCVFYYPPRPISLSLSLSLSLTLSLPLSLSHTHTHKILMRLKCSLCMRQSKTQNILFLSFTFLKLRIIFC